MGKQPRHRAATPLILDHLPMIYASTLDFEKDIGVTL
jgi:hypothetical protein